MLAMFLGTNRWFEEPAIGFLDVLDLCVVLVLGACRKPTSGARTPTVFAICAQLPFDPCVSTRQRPPGVHVQQQATASSKIRACHNLCSIRSMCAARSPMITQGAMVLPVVTRGMIDPSAMRRLSTPYTLRLASTTHISCRPILAVDV